MRKKIIITVIVVLGVVALGIKGKGLLGQRKSEVDNTALPSVDTISVPVVKPKQGSLEKRLSYLAQVDSDKSITLTTKLAGYVEKLYVEESQRVKKGQMLVSIDAIELRSSIDALKATLSTQKSDLELAQQIHSRNQKLYRVGGVSKEKLETSALGVKAKKSVLKNTQEKIDSLTHQLSYLGIRAPFDGVVDKLMLHEGDLAATGKAILALSNGKKKLIFSYASNQAKMIKKGLSVYRQEEKIGEVSTLLTTSKNGLLGAEIRLNKPIDIPVGTSMNIEILAQAEHGCLLPANTLVHKKEGTYVMVYKEKKFSEQKVDVKMQNEFQALLVSCPSEPVAYGNEVKLVTLPAYDRVEVFEGR